MRLDGALVWCLMISPMLGCLSSDAPASGTSSFLDRFLSAPRGLGDDAVQIEIALIRQPLGERYINQDLWDVVDEQVVPLEQRPSLEANGFRLGLIGGGPSAQLQDLLTSPKSCISARRIAIQGGKSVFVPLGAGDRTCTLKVRQPQAIELAEASDAGAIELKKAQFGLSVQATNGPNGRITLKMEPQVRHGEGYFIPRPSQGNGSWTLDSGRREEKYAQLAWELSLSLNQYAVIGGLLECEQTLGHYDFVHAGAEMPWQYLLVIRATPSNASTAESKPQSGRGQNGPVPLAVQSTKARR